MICLFFLFYRWLWSLSKKHLSSRGKILQIIKANIPTQYFPYFLDDAMLSRFFRGVERKRQLDKGVFQLCFNIVSTMLIQAFNTVLLNFKLGTKRLSQRPTNRELNTLYSNYNTSKRRKQYEKVRHLRQIFKRTTD